MYSPLLRRLSLRVRLLCGLTLLVASFLPPYVPRASLSSEELVVQNPQFLFVEDGFLMKSSSLGSQGSRLAYGAGVIHVVKESETLQALAELYRVRPETIRWANGLTDRAVLQPSQELLILPVDGVMHTVRRGQTLARIAQLYDIPQEDIIRQNRIKGGFIVAGEQLIIPSGRPIIGTPADAAARGPLRFTERLTPRQIELKLREQEETRREKLRGAPTVVADVTSGTLQMPCNTCFFTQYYHPGHYAVDLQTRGGGPVFAAEAGTVIRSGSAGWNGGYGGVIEIDHGNGLITLYAHNKKHYVEIGDTVSRGQVIGDMGATGLVYGKTGIHVHFEVRVNGVKKNPLLYLE